MNTIPPKISKNPEFRDAVERVPTGHSRKINGPENKTIGRAVLLLALCFASCGKSPESTRTPKSPNPEVRNTASLGPAANPWFEEVAAQAGVTFRHSSGHAARFYMPEMETGGVGLLDYDGDGLLDIFCVNGGSLDPNATNRPGCKLYHNLGHWKFEDVTERAGVAGHGEYGMGCACGDYNNDGRMDIYVSHLNGGILYRNNGDGTFTDVTREAGITSTSWGTSCAFFDYDGDGNLDLVVANYIRWSRETELNCYSRGGLPDYCSPMNYKAPAIDNKGIGAARGWGLICADLTGDGLPDIFQANDEEPNQLWVNKGNGKFEDEALIRGCAVNVVGMPRAGMGVAAVDIRQRGWLDLFVTHLVGESNGWFANTNGYFTDFVTAKGPSAPSLPLTGFGLGFADFDHDGNLDLYVANGRVKYGLRDLDPKNPYAEPNTLLRGLGNGEFEEVQPPGGTAQSLLACSRGAAFGDLDNDGAIDIVIINKDGPVHLLQNVATKRGNWIMFRVLNQKGLDAINASVRVEASGKVQFRDVIPNQSYCSSSDPRVHFGLGDAQKVERVTVRWPQGSQELFGPFAAGQLEVLRQGNGTKAE